MKQANVTRDGNFKKGVNDEFGVPRVAIIFLRNKQQNKKKKAMADLKV
jgi:hypothetical protein